MRAGDSLPPSVPLSFSNCFWGKDDKGVDILSDRMSDAKLICEEVKAFYRERAAAEEEYAKKLLKISKMPLGSKECGTLKGSLEAVKTELTAMGNAHSEVAAGMRRELEDALVVFTSTLRDRRKLIQTNIEKLRRTKQAQEQQLHKLKEKYDADCIKINGFIAQQNMLMGKELEKNNTKLEKCQMSVQTSNKDYKAAVKVLAETTHRWNQEWKNACDRYQDLEEERIDFLKSNLWTYANIMSTVCVSDDEACEKIRVSLEKCEVDEVIQTFVHTKGTGQEIPDPPKYQNFYRKEEHDDEVGYKLAQFSRDSNPQFRSSTPSQFPHSDDEMTLRPMTGMSQHEPMRPSTGISRHEEPTRPMTGMARHEDPGMRPMTGMSTRHEESPTRPLTGVSARGGGQPRERPKTMQSMMDDSPPSSQRSRSRGTSQSPLKGIINEYPEEGITQFCRSDSSSARHGPPNLSRHSSASSTYSASEAPTHSTSDSSNFALNTPIKSAMAPPSPKVLRRRSDTKETQSPAASPAKKSHSFWNFGSKSPKQPTPKSTPTTSPMKNSKSAPTGMAMSMSVPSLEIGGTRNSPGNRSRRGGSEEPIAPGASVMLNIGNNVLEVNNPDAKKTAKYEEEPIDANDPLMAALEDLKNASKTPRMPSPSKRSPVDSGFDRRGSRDDNMSAPMYDNRPPPSRQEGMRPSTSQNIRQSQTPPSRGSTSHGNGRVSPSPVYDTRRNTLGAPPPAHSAAEMERTRRQYATQVQQVFGGGGRPSTAQQMPPRSISPRPTSRQSQYADDSYNGRPMSSMSVHPQDLPPRSRSPAPRHSQDIPRSRSPAPMRHPQDIPPRSRSPAPPRPISRQEAMEYARPTSRQEYDDRRRSVSPAPYQGRPMYPDEMRRSPSPQPYPRSASPAPMSARPRSSAAVITPNNPFGISIDRFGNVMDANGPGRSPSPQPNAYPERNSRQQYAYGSNHRHDIDDQSRYSVQSSPAHVRARSKSQSDLRTRSKYTEDGRQILFTAKALYDYNAAIPEECSFRKGDVVLVTKTQDDGWWVGEIAGSRPVSQGLVPSNFFKTMPQN